MSGPKPLTSYAQCVQNKMSWVGRLLRFRHIPLFAFYFLLLSYLHSFQRFHYIHILFFFAAFADDSSYVQNHSMGFVAQNRSALLSGFFVAFFVLFFSNLNLLTMCLRTNNTLPLPHKHLFDFYS